MKIYDSLLIRWEKVNWTYFTKHKNAKSYTDMTLEAIYWEQ